MNVYFYEYVVGAQTLEHFRYRAERKRRAGMWVIVILLSVSCVSSESAGVPSEGWRVVGENESDRCR